MTSGDVIAFTRCNDAVVHVGIVDLELHKLHVGMVAEDLLQQGRTVVKGKTDVLDESLVLQLVHIVPNAIAVVSFQIDRIDAMQEIEIEVACTRTLQTHLDFVLRLFLARTGKSRSIEFVRQIIAFARIATTQSLLCSRFRTRIDVSRVEILSSCCYESIHHLLGLFQVGRFVCQLRQAHESEAQLHAILHKFTHRI